MNISFKLTVIIFTIVFAVFPVYADDLRGKYNPLDQKKDKVVFEMLKPLAEQGNATAQYRLGQFYFLGRGVPKDEKEAVKWLQRAAEQGVPEAQLNLGVSYYAGVGVTQDSIQAYKWFSIAGAFGNEVAQKRLSVVERTMTPAQIAEAQKLAREWMEENK